MFELDGSITFVSSASYEVNLNGIVDYDKLVVSGPARSISLGGAELVIALDSVPAVGSQETFTIIDSTGSGSTVSGTFTAGGVTLNDGDTFSVGSTIFRINYNPGGATGDVTLTEAGDDDRDGVSDEVESAAPNGGDGNADGIADNLQDNVASLPNATNGSYVTVAVAGVGGGLVPILGVVAAIDNPSPADAKRHFSPGFRRLSNRKRDARWFGHRNHDSRHE